MPSKAVYSWFSPKLEVRNTDNYGKGVFATETICESELLTVFGGRIFTRAEEDKLPEGMQDYGLQISEEFVIGARCESDIECDDYFNHSCDPNAGFKGQIFLVAMKEIAKDEQVTFDYGMVLYEASGARRYKIDCFCKSEICRGSVTDNDWKLPDLQRRYDGYFQWFLQEKIRKSVCR